MGILLEIMAYIGVEAGFWAMRWKIWIAVACVCLFVGGLFGAINGFEDTTSVTWLFGGVITLFISGITFTISRW